MAEPAPDLISSLRTYVESIDPKQLVVAAALLAGSLVVGNLLGGAARRTVQRSGNTGMADLARRGIVGLSVGLGLAMAMQQLGFDLGVVLGAAGVFSVALGFAAQTSASNLISGLFLLAEGAVSVGSIIRVDALTGEVLSVDLLSIKLRTFDNLLVRVPNETVVKSQVTNLSAYPIRRIDLQLAVSPAEDLAAVEKLLLVVAESHTEVLQEPPPLIQLGPFSERGLELQLSCWARRESFLPVRNALYRGCFAAMKEAGVVLPVPHRMLAAAQGQLPVSLRPPPSDAPIPDVDPCPPESGE